jgi:hypothetical protein
VAPVEAGKGKMKGGSRTSSRAAAKAKKSEKK